MENNNSNIIIIIKIMIKIAMRIIIITVIINCIVVPFMCSCCSDADTSSVHEQDLFVLYYSAVLYYIIL